jgi:Tol biopolymer transport system component/predicted Ser/Thr protein kinase
LNALPPELQKLDRFRVVRKLGAGGMGEVFLAEDTRLGRKVALKLLPEGLLSDPEIRRRFSQEARAVSALNHPQIVTIYDVGSADQRDFIAMEYVDGQTLREQIAAGPLEVRRAFDVVAQTAGGLAAAHEAGIVHRDIKPENLMVNRNGQLKIMDFGLAKLVERQTAPLLASGLATAAQTPPPSSHGTATGVILGTVSYMSPEQAQGRPVDHRTDIFSLGLVLYEALTGSRPFSGKSAVETLHAIINEEPVSASQRNPNVPPEATEILGKALAKDPAERYQHAADFALDLRRARRVMESGISRPAVPLPAAPISRLRPILWAGVALAAAALAAGAWYLGRSGARPRGSDLADVTLTPLTSEPGYEGEPTFSPDGETIAYVSNRTGNFEIFLKQVSGGPDVNVTNNPADDAQPAFSPDGKQIAFVSTRESRTPLVYENFGVPPTGGDIWVMPALGGSPRRIAEAGNFPSWSPDGSSLVFMSGGAFKKKIFRVPASGGESREIPIRSPGGEGVFRYILYPTLSPDGEWILFQVEQFRINVAPSSGGEAKLLCRGRRPVWAPDGRSIVFSNADPGKNYSLWRIPFSPTKGAADGPGEPITVGRGVDTQAAMSRDGRAIAFTALEQTFNLETIPFDAELGQVTGDVKVLTSGNNDIEWKSLSPDGRSVVYENAGRIWRLDPGQAAYPLTSDPAFIDGQPRWSPDGHSILFERQHAGERGSFELWLMAADGASPRQLVENGRAPYWMPDSRGITYCSTSDYYLYRLDLATRKSLRATDEETRAPLHTVSNDGKWIVYQSSAEAHVTIRARPIDGGKTLVVASAPGQMGSGHPMLSPSGNWFYYQVDHKNIFRLPGPSQGWRKVEPVKVTNFPESGLFIEDPRLSPDGKQLIYSRGRITGDLWLLRFPNRSKG